MTVNTGICDLDRSARVIKIEHDTPSYDDSYLYEVSQVILNGSEVTSRGKGRLQAETTR